MNITEEVKKQKHHHLRLAIKHMNERRDDLTAKIAVWQAEVDQITESLKKLEE